MKDKDIEKVIMNILEKSDLELGYEFQFPKYKEMPEEVRLALKVLQQHEMKVLITLKEKSNK